MKKFTKVLMAAVAVSTLCFAGCKNANDLLGEEFIDYTTKSEVEGAEAVATINYTNEDTEEVKRGLRFFSNKKKDIAMNVVMENAKDPSGFMSVIFNKTENKDDTLNFIALGFNSNTTGNKAKIACTYYKSVKKEDFAAANFGKTDTDKSSLDDDIQELMPNANNDGFVVTNIAPDADGKLNVGFVITANKGSDPYTVRIYANKTAEELNKIADAIDSEKTDDDDVIGNPEKEFNIKAADLGLERDAASAKIEAGIGFYANVYANKKTLKGEWQVGDISHNPDGIIWEDEIPNTLNIQLAE